jgi:nitrate reductase NapE component
VNRVISSTHPLRRRLPLVIASAVILIVVLPILAFAMAGGLGGAIESVIR